MSVNHLILPAFAGLALATSASAGIVTLTPDQIHLEDTNTASFDNGEIAFTPLNAGSPTTFNAQAARLGIDDAGTSNVNAFFGPNEQLQIDLAAMSGLTQIGYDFTSTGAAGQFTIAGFLSDPGASFSGNLAGGPTSSYAAGVLTVNTTTFNGEDTFLDLANAAASAGQTLLVTPQGQLPITTVSYDNAVPEPGSLALLALGGLAMVRRRR